MVKPVVAVAVVVGSLISGAVMYTVGASQRVDAFETAEFVQTVDGGFVPVSRVSVPQRRATRCRTDSDGDTSRDPD